MWIFQTSDETEVDSHTAYKIFAYNFFKAPSLAVVFYLPWAPVASQEEQAVLWRLVTKFGESLHVLLVPPLRNCLTSSMPLSGAEKDIKIRWSESNTLCSQEMQGKAAAFSQAVTMYFLFCILPSMSPVAEGQPLQLFCSCTPRPDFLTVLKASYPTVWLLLNTGQCHEI